MSIEDSIRFRKIKWTLLIATLVVCVASTGFNFGAVRGSKWLLTTEHIETKTNFTIMELGMWKECRVTKTYVKENDEIVNSTSEGGDKKEISRTCNDTNTDLEDIKDGQNAAILWSCKVYFVGFIFQCLVCLILFSLFCISTLNDALATTYNLYAICLASVLTLLYASAGMCITCSYVFLAQYRYVQEPSWIRGMEKNHEKQFVYQLTWESNSFFGCLVSVFGTLVAIGLSSFLLSYNIHRNQNSAEENCNDENEETAKKKQKRSRCRPPLGIQESVRNVFAKSKSYLWEKRKQRMSSTKETCDSAEEVDDEYQNSEENNDDFVPIPPPMSPGAARPSSRPMRAAPRIPIEEDEEDEEEEEEDDFNNDTPQQSQESIIPTTTTKDINESSFSNNTPTRPKPNPKTPPPPPPPKSNKPPPAPPPKSNKPTITKSKPSFHQQSVTIPARFQVE